MTEDVTVQSKPEIPNGVITRILRLDEDMQCKKFRVQRDSLKAINISMALFLKLVTKTCEVVHATSSSTHLAGGKRAANLLDLEHLSKAVNRYEVLAFMNDLLAEMSTKTNKSLELIDEPDNAAEHAVKRKEREDVVEIDGNDQKRPRDESQMSITSFFKAN